MAVIIRFPLCNDIAGRRLWRLGPEVRVALSAMEYAVPGIKVEFESDGHGAEWATVGPLSHQQTWFTIRPGSNRSLRLLDERARFVGRYASGESLRAGLQPLARNLVQLCSLPPVGKAGT